MGKHPTWAIIFAGLLFVVFPKIMLGTEYGIVVDGKLTKLGAIVGRSTPSVNIPNKRSTSPRRSRSTEVPKYTLYEDDGISLDYLQGHSVKKLIKWDDAAKQLSLEPASKQSATRTFQVEIIPDGVTREIQYRGQALELNF